MTPQFLGGRGDLSVTWWQVDYTGLLSSRKGRCFDLTGINTCCRHAFASPVHKAYAKTPMGSLRESTSHQHGIPHSTAPPKGTDFTADEAWPWARAWKILWSYYIPQYPEAAGWINQKNILLKSLLRRQLGDDTLQSCSDIFQDAVRTLRQWLVETAVSPTAGMHRSSNQEREPGVAPLTTPLATFLTPASATSAFPSTGVSAPKAGTLPAGVTATFHWTASWDCFMAVNRHAKKRVVMLARPTEPGSQGELGCCYITGAQRSRSETPRPAAGPRKITITQYEQDFTWPRLFRNEGLRYLNRQGIIISSSVRWRRREAGISRRRR